MSDEPKPPTDRELELLAAGHALVGETDEMTVGRLVAEVRRLRALTVCPNCGDVVEDLSLYHPGGGRCRRVRGEWHGKPQE